METSHDGRHLFTVNTASNSISRYETGARAVGGFTLEGGDLTELSSSPTPLPSEAAPFGIVVNPRLAARRGGHGSLPDHHVELAAASSSSASPPIAKSAVTSRLRVSLPSRLPSRL